MDEKTAIRLRRSAIMSSVKYGFINDAEDLAHNVLVNYMEGKGAHQTVDQATIDQIRKMFGSIRRERPKVDGRRKNKVTPKPIFVGEEPLPFIVSDSVVGTSLPDFNKALNGLTIAERAVACLICMYGLKVGEIAFVFGVNQARASQIVGQIVGKIKTPTDF